MNPKVDFFFAKAGKWQAEVEKMRSITLDTGLAEELKWGCPCYSYMGANVVLIHHFKEYCAYLFFKGALMNDANGILVRQTENVQSARQVRFTDIRQIAELEPVLKAYIYEAVEIEKSGIKVEFKKTQDFAVAEEFQAKLDAMPVLRTAFEALTPGRQKGYLLYFAQAKQAKTREARIEKYVPHILAGKGLDDE